MIVEAEIRSFISKEKYEELLNFFKKNADLEKEDYQETFYFDCLEDLRIQKNRTECKIWLKKGIMHDESREEFEIKIPSNQFENAQKIFTSLGLDVEIKWIRERKQFNWNGIRACLDSTKGYGYILELEKKCTDSEKENTIKMIKSKFIELGVEITSRDEFDRKFEHYRKNWKNLI